MEKITKTGDKFLLYGLKNLINNPRENFTWGIDQYFHDTDTNLLTISGWVFSNKSKHASEISLPLPKGVEVESYKRFDRGDVSQNFGLAPNAEAGFEIVLRLPENKETPKGYTLIFEDKENEIKSVVRAHRPDPYHYNPLSLAKYYYQFFRQNGAKRAVKQFLKQGNKRWDDYNFWLEQKKSLDREKIREEIDQFEKKPKISIVVPVYNLDEKYLRSMIDSVRDQLYTNWELVLADDNSPSPHVKRVLTEYASQDDRIVPVFRDKNGHISEATNSGLNVATGDFIGFMDHDDELPEDALYEYVKLINEKDDADLIYCDQDFITTDGLHTQPFFKSNWNPRLLLGHNYITHFVVVSRDLFEKTGKLRTRYNGSQDYDFLIRAFPHARGIYNIPKILYNWRMVEGSVAENPEAKGYAYEAGKEAIRDHLERMNKPADVEVGEFYGTYRLTRTDAPSVSIIIVDEDGKRSRETLAHLLGSTDYPNYKIIAVNFKEQVGTLEPEKVRYVYNNSNLTYNELLNFGASKAEGEYLVFVKAGMVPKSVDWLKNLVDETVLDETGIVGGLVLDQDQKILNAGMNYDVPSEKIVYPYQDKNIGEDPLGYYYRLNLPQNVMAVTSFCFLISRELWNELGGFGQFRHPLAEIDLALRALKKGKRTVFTPRSQQIWMGQVEDKLLRFPEKDQLYLYKNPPLEELVEFLEVYTPEELEDIYTNKTIQRYRRQQDQDYDGPSEDAHV